MFVLHITPRLGPAKRATRSPRPSMSIAAIVLGAAMMAIPLSAAGCSDDEHPLVSGDASEPAGAVASVFLSQDDGRVEISRRDDYVAAMSRFDLQSRTDSLQPITVDDYLRAMPAHVREFSEEERQHVAAALGTVLDRMAAMGLQPPGDPGEVRFVRTDGKEEGDAAAYTRGGSIFVCDGLFTQDASSLSHTIAHEMFHLWSRANPDVVRWPTHEALGFVRATDTSFPASLADRRITNPDDPSMQETVDVQFDGTSAAVFLALIASADYHGGSLFDYLQLQLVEPVTGTPHSLDSAQGLFEQIGTTTDYTLSAEEISAEHFALGLFQDAAIHDPALIQAVLRPFAR